MECYMILLECKYRIITEGSKSEEEEEIDREGEKEAERKNVWERDKSRIHIDEKLTWRNHILMKRKQLDTK